MKVLFIHLSDLHLSADISQFINADSMADALESKVLESEKVFVLFTGDFTFTGSVQQLRLFDAFINGFIDSLSRYIDKENIHLIVVPGNHDINLSAENDTNYVIDSTKKYSADEIDKFADNSLSYMKNTMDLCRKYGCFVCNDYVDDISVDNGNYIYHFSLINSAPLSSRFKRDKENHHIPNSSFNLHNDLRIGKSTIEILMSHHRPDWFDYESSSYLKEFIKDKTSIIFYGHEHEQDSELVIRGSHSNLVIQGGELKQKNQFINGSFNTLVFDEEKMECSIDKYSYNFETQELRTEEISENHIIDQFKLYKNSNIFTESFLKKSIQKNKVSVKDLFVMPTLYFDDKPKFNNVDSLLAHINSSKEIYIRGNAKSGKTVLLQYLYLYYSNSCVPLYVRCSDNMSPVVENSIEKAFLEQYEGGREKYRCYRALPKDKKVILIDNLNRLKNKDVIESFLNYAKDNCDLVIVTYANSFSPTKRIIEDSLIGFSNVFDLLPFSFLQRKKLAENICKVLKLNKKETEMVFNVYESSISTSKILDFGDPEYATMLIEDIVANKSYENRDKTSAYSIVFTTSINNAFLNAGCSNKLDECINLTAWLARKIWRRDTDISFNESFIMESYKECDDYYRNLNVSFSRYFELLLQSEIVIKINEDSYIFRRITYFAYFVGFQISNDFKSNEDKELNDIITNIGHHLNSDVLLFASYNLKDKTIFKRIEELLNHFLIDVEPINFDTKNNIVVKSIATKDVGLKETYYSKGEYEKDRDTSEKESMPAKAKQNDSIEKGIEEDSDIINKSLKLIEIMSKALSGFSGLFSGEERKRYISCSLSACLRLVQKLFTISKEQYEFLESEFEKGKRKLLESIKEKEIYSKIESAFSSFSIGGLLYNYLVNIVISLEFLISDWMSSSVSLPIIETTDSSLLTNQLFKLCSYINTGSLEKFNNLFKKVRETNGERFPVMMLFMPLVNLYLLKNIVDQRELVELSKASNVSLSTLKEIAPLGQIKLVNK